MFNWICPKCGKEVPPSYSECPNCAAKDQTATEPAAAPASAPAQAPPRPVPPGQRRPAFPVWLLSLLIAVALIGAGAAFLLLRSPKSADAPSRPAAVLETPSAPSSAAAPASAVAKNLELTGFRLTEDSKQKAVLQFLVVNHSAADLGDVGAKVNLSALTTQQRLQPVGTFVFRATLGPYESKELKVPVDTKLRVYELPDWQFLRAEIVSQ
jgi:hypothetical protein